MSMTKPTAEQVTFKSQGLGAVTRNVQDKLAEVVSVKDFGAVGDGVSDDTAAIQAAIDWAMYRNLPFNTSRTWIIPCVVIPAGRYKISDAIQLGYGDTFRSVHIRGDGRVFQGLNGFAGTVILPTFNDRPAIAVNGGRSNTIEALSIRGQNSDWIQTNGLGSFGVPVIDDLVENNWVDPSFPASSSSRYAPYCGIAIDPYGGPRPAVSYPDVNFPGWLNYTTQYQKVLSSAITIRDVEIRGFVVGVAIQPCDADGNGDFIQMQDVVIEFCQYGVSIGNTQARDTGMRNANMARCWCFVATGAHGRQGGKPGIDVQNSSFNFGIYGAIIPNMALGGNVAFRNVYSENLYSIGTLGIVGGSRQNSVLFSECEFSFDSHRHRIIPSAIVTAGCPITFDGCLFAPRRKYADASGMPNVVRLNCLAQQTAIRNCFFQVGENATTLHEKQAINATCGFVIGNGDTSLVAWSSRLSHLWNMSSGSTAFFGFNPWHESNVPYSRTTCIPVYAKHVQCNDWDYGIPFPRMGTLRGKSTIASISQSGRTVTADLTGHKSVLSLQTIGGDVGDIIVDSVTGTMFIVSSRTGTTIEMVAQNNLDTNGDLVVTITFAGNFHYLMCRAFALNSVHYGDISSSSATISNVKGADGTSRNVDSATVGVQAGDFAMTGAGTAIGVVSPSSAEIASVTSSTIVLSGNARYTAARERMAYFIKQATANNT